MRAGAVPLLALTLIAGGCDSSPPAPRQEGNGQPASVSLPQPSADLPGATPMAQRVAVLGLLNKRNGIVRDLVLRPGQAVRVRDVVVRLRACETTAPWETEKLTGAFVQLDVQQAENQWQRVFSGWLYKESPSLNVVEHPVYDVWPKSCAMTYPSAAASPEAPVASSSRSSARNSAPAEPPRASPEPAAEEAPATAEPETDPAPTAPPSAADSNST